MPSDPTLDIGEILGRRAVIGFDPAASDFHCPYMDRRCNKSINAATGEPYPVCSVMTAKRGMVAVCPKRLYQPDFIKDVIDHCWPSDEKPARPEVAAEVQMTGFGNVDFVIADRLDDGSLGEFLSIEVQAIDITGSVRPSYEAIRQNRMLQDSEKKAYGLNLDNMYKRYVTQLIRKGYFHHHWGTKIVAVMQDVIYKSITDRFHFFRAADVRDKTINIIFVIYKMVPDPDREGEMKLVFDFTEGTTHSNLQQAVLYATAPTRSEFLARVSSSLDRRAKDVAEIEVDETFVEDTLGTTRSLGT